MNKQEEKEQLMSYNPKPHCWGKMDWILKYEEGKEPRSSICNCEHGAMTCKKLTRSKSTSK